MRNHNAPWRVLAASVCGTRHRKAGLSCQDAHYWECGTDGTLVLAMADGAGSSALGDVGATVAVRSAVVAARRSRTPTSFDETAWQAYLREVLLAAREGVETEARSRGVALGDLATTLAVVAASNDCTAAAHLGDGAVIIRDDEGPYTALTPPQLGEHLNETAFLSDDDAMDTLRIIVRRGAARQIGALSDGLQMLALHMPEGVPHTPFFEPLFDHVIHMTDKTAAHEQFVAFLTSPRITERTDDDVTLCLAVRVED